MKHLRPFLAAAMTAATVITAALPQRAVAASPEDARLIAQSKRDLQPAPGDPGITSGFQRALKNAPWLADSRQSIALVSEASPGGAPLGTAGLLDAEGTLAVDAHEIKGRQQVTVSFFTAGSQTPAVTVAKIVATDPKLDLAFATIDPKFVAENNLTPLAWDQAADLAPGQHFFIAGYANGAPHLHAAPAIVLRYEPHADAEMFNGAELSPARFCKIAAHGVGYFGMSGGPGLKGGFLAGLLNTITNAKLATVYMTPLSAVRDAYVKLFPDRARRAGVTADVVRPECVFEGETAPRP